MNSLLGRWCIHVLLLACLNGLMAEVGWAGTNTWTAIGPPGGYARGLAFNSSRAGVVYTVVEDELYRSADNGVTWQTSPKDFTDTLLAMVVDPNNGDIIYVVEGSNGLWRSTDQGNTFSFLGPVSNCFVTALAISGDGSRLMAACAFGGNLMVSDNRGVTWQDRTPVLQAGQTPTYFTALAINPINRDIMYAGRFRGGVYKTTNGGASWSQVFPGPGAPLDYGVYIDPTNVNRVIVAAETLVQSFDGGLSWLGITGAAGPVVAFDRNNTSRLYVGSINSAVFRTADGFNWDLFNWTNGVTCGWFSQLLVNSQDSNKIIGAGDQGICRSDDGGATWTHSSDGILHSRVEVLRTAASGPRRILLGTSPGFAYIGSSQDGTWTRLAANLGINGAPQGVVSAAFVPGATASSWLVGSRTGNVMRTVNSGATWLFSDRQLLFKDLVADTTVPGQFFGATSNGVVRSIDGGAQWTSLVMPAGLDNYGAVAISPSNPNVLYAGAGYPIANGKGGVTKSVDAGQTWTLANSGIEAFSVNRIAVDPIDANIVYAATVGGLFKTSNGGLSWNGMADVNGRAVNAEDFVFDPGNSSIQYVAHGLLERSVDGGQSWQVIYQAANNQFDLRRVALDPLNSSILYAGTRESGVRVMEIAPDVSVVVSQALLSVPDGTAARVNYTVRNFGAFAVTSVLLRGSWPVGSAALTLQSPRGACAVTSGAFTCPIGSLQPNESVVVAADLTSLVGSFSLTTNVSAYQQDSNTTNNSTQTAIAVTPLADLTVTLTPSASSLELGQSAGISSRLSNAGPSAANNVQAVYDVGALLGVSGISITRGNCVVAGSRMNCDVGSIAPGDSVTVAFTVTATGPGIATVAAHLATSAADPNSGNNDANVKLTIPSTDLALSLTATQSTITVGQTVTFSAVATNAGSAAAATATVIFDMGSLSSFSEITTSRGTCATSASQISCALGALPNGSTATIGFTATGNSVGTTTVAGRLQSATADTSAANNNASVPLTINAVVPVVTVNGGRSGGGSMDIGTLVLLILMLMSMGAAHCQSRGRSS